MQRRHEWDPGLASSPQALSWDVCSTTESFVVSSQGLLSAATQAHLLWEQGRNGWSSSAGTWNWMHICTETP